MKTNLFILVLLVMVLSACSTPATPAPVPTNTSAPPPTQTLIPPTATLPPSPTATPDPLLFQDQFDGALDSSWQWIRENNKYWNLTNTSGWLEIVAGSGSVGAGNIKNLLVRQASNGNFELETRLKFKPTGNYQLAGLLIYESAENHVQFGRAFCNAPQCARDGYYLDLISGGKFTPENFATKASESDIVYLRLRREGNIFTARVSENGKDWQLIGAHKSNLTPLFVGLIAGQAVNSLPKPAQFDYFTINALP